MKVGDIVICTRAKKDLTVGKEYTIHHIHDVYGDENDDAWIDIIDDAYDIHSISSGYYKLKDPLFPCFIQINDQLHSKIVQEWLFKQGCEWNTGGKLVQCVSAKYLLISTGKRISWTNSLVYCGNKELIFEYSLTPRIVDRVETVEFNGQKYDKKKLEEALALIQPVDCG